MVSKAERPRNNRMRLVPIAAALALALMPGAFAQTPAPNPWLPQGSAVVQALDKVNAQTSVLTIRIGQTAQFGALQIKATACVVRPPDRPADAAAFLAITNQKDSAGDFSGWMLKSNPAVSMMHDAIYDVRVVGCAA